MSTDVVMPQMGESIAEGTIVRWIKKVGDSVDRDEPLFEISTDKVDAEIPSPVAGIIAEIRAKEGETVPVNSVVAVIGAAGAAAPRPSAPVPAPPPPATAIAPPPTTAPPASMAGPNATPASAAAALPSSHASTPAAWPPRPGFRPAPEERAETRSSEEQTPDDRAPEGRERLSPLVRKIAKEHNVDLSQIRGTGLGGRITKDDILAFIGGGREASQQSLPVGTPAPPAAAGSPAQARRAPMAPASAPTNRSAQPVPGTVAQMSPMRKKIAEHMILSRRTSAHVHSVFEVNFATVSKIREARKQEYESQGAKLTYLSFILKAAIDALRAVPVVNASVDGESIVYHQDVNIGIAVALDWGLIVPVIKQADRKNLLDLSRSVADLAARARSKQLKPEEVSGGTFTITNPGVFGALFGMPIISQPQVAILGIGAVEKRVIVVDDAIAIRPMAYLSIGYDHRIIDGAVADEFMSHVKKSLENWDAASV